MVGLIAAAPASAQVVLLGNMPSSDGTSDGLSNSTKIAVSFTVGSSGFSVSNVSLRLEGIYYAYPVVNFHSNLAGAPGATVGGNFTMGQMGNLADYSFTSGTTLELSANTTYWMVAESQSGSSSWKGSGATPTGLASFGGYSFTSDSGTTWAAHTSSMPSFAINGSAIPEPSTYAAIAGALAIGFAAYRRRASRQDSECERS